MKIIVPCAGRSSRYPNMAPKWMLPDTDGLPMVYKSIAGLGATLDDFIFTILREHEDKFNTTEGLASAFGRRVNCIVLDKPTRSQSETVAETLRRASISEPFLVKDSDNFFEVRHLSQNYNYVCVASLNSFSHVNPQNKSYVQVDQEDVIINFREKQVISDLFSVGGYYFTSPREFLTAFDELSAGSRITPGELYLSEIIAFMSMTGTVFKVQRIESYQDWGTVQEWRGYLQKKKVFFIGLDGFLMEHGSLYFKPKYEEVKSNPAAVSTVQQMIRNGQSIFYLSVRPKDLEALTLQQLQDMGLPIRPIIFGCDMAQWTLLTAPHPNQPGRTSDAFEIAADDPNMALKLGFE